MKTQRHSKKRRTQSKKKRTQSKKRTQRRKYKGGNTVLASQPFNSYGFENGASSPREAALLHEKNNSDMQHKLNQLSGGKRRSRSKRRSMSMSKRKSIRKRKGGGSIEIPTFPPIGGIKQAYSSTDLSIGSNTNLVSGLNSAENDCFATDTCTPTQGGAKRRSRKN
jgi:hypothetical protein